MKEKPWANLPNAPWIDRILADVKARPEVWSAAQDAAWGAAWHAARVAIWDATRDAAWGAAWHAARVAIWDATRDAAWDATWGAALDAAWGAARSAARDALSALIAWPECAYMLNQDPEVLEMTLRLATGDRKHQAVLLYPACVALHKGEVK